MRKILGAWSRQIRNSNSSSGNTAKCQARNTIIETRNASYIFSQTVLPIFPSYSLRGMCCWFKPLQPAVLELQISLPLPIRCTLSQYSYDYLPMSSTYAFSFSKIISWKNHPLLHSLFTITYLKTLEKICVPPCFHCENSLFSASLLQGQGWGRTKRGSHI